MSSITKQILKGNFKINVDTVDLVLPEATANVESATNVLVIAADGTQVQERSNRVRVGSADSDYALHLRQRTNFLTGSTEVFVEGPLSANRYGQNVWTYSSLKSCCKSTVRRLIKTAAVDADEDAKNAWLNGEIELHRVDLAVNFRLESTEQVMQAIDQIKHFFVASRKHCSLYHRYAAWCPRNSKFYQISVYDKGAQLDLKASRKRIRRNYERLRNECATLLRVELRLRRAELVELNKSRACDWVPGDERRLFRRYVSRLPIPEIALAPPMDSDFKRVNMRMRPVLALHRAGIDTRPLYSAQTIYKHKRYFEKEGINTAPARSPTSISLADILGRKGAIPRTPRWLIEDQMAPRPRITPPKTRKASI